MPHNAPFIMFMMVLLFVMTMTIGSAVFSAWLRYRKEGERAGRKDFEELAERVSKIEQRLANLETIVLEAEKIKAFREL